MEHKAFFQSSVIKAMLSSEPSIDETIKWRVSEIVMFTADNEREDCKKSLEIYKKSLGGRVIELKGKGHFVFKDMGTQEFPELLKEIL